MDDLDLWPKTIVICGPTASGKTRLSVELAKIIGAVVLSADSMAVYREMNVGTAKPTLEEQQGIDHFGIDIADPGEDHSLAQWLAVAEQVRRSCLKAATPMVIVGGTGLYVHAFVDAMKPPPEFPEIRTRLESEIETESDLVRLYTKLQQLDPDAAQKMEPNNRRRVIRALEVCLGTDKKFSSFGPGIARFDNSQVQIVGIEVGRDELRSRIEKRFDSQLENGFENEVAELLTRQKGWSKTARQALGYRELIGVVERTKSLDEARDEAVLRTKQFAIRQIRWFRRDDRIVWASPEKILNTVDVYMQQ